MNVFGFVKKPKAKCKVCGKIWDLYGKPDFTDMYGFVNISSCKQIYNPKDKDGMECKN